MMERAEDRDSAKVPEVTLIFWLIKIAVDLPNWQSRAIQLLLSPLKEWVRRCRNLRISKQPAPFCTDQRWKTRS